MASALRFDLDDPEQVLEGTEPLSVFDLPYAAAFSGANRRFQPRVRSPFTARMVRIDGEAVPMAVRLYGIDLSVGGMLCHTDELVWPGNRIHLELHLGDGPEPLEVVARVVDIVGHRGEPAMRVRFDEVPDFGRARIARWMARR